MNIFRNFVVLDRKMILEHGENVFVYFQIYVIIDMLIFSIPFLSLSPRGDTPWSPIVVNETYPTRNLIRLHQLHSLVNTGFASHNIAHGLWEDIGSIYYSLERMNLADQNLIIMHFNKIPNTPLFRSYEEYVLPALTKHPLVHFGKPVTPI